MPKSRIMSAGTVGTNRRIRVNGPEGGGNKLQGLPPICNMRSPLVPYVRTRADGENRNVVFCINQLSGGVGAKRGQFGPGNRAGVGQTGGCAKPTPPWYYGNQRIINAFLKLREYLKNTANTGHSKPLVLSLVGENESFKSDGLDPSTIKGFSTDDQIYHFEEGGNGWSLLTEEMKEYARILNSMKLYFEIAPGEGKKLHIAGAMSSEAYNYLIWHTEYGFALTLSPETYIFTFGGQWITSLQMDL